MNMPPCITLLVFAFNRSALVAAAVRSCLAQACEPREIVLSDDASTDDTFAVLQALAAAYQGLHRVRAHTTTQLWPTATGS